MCNDIMLLKIKKHLLGCDEIFTRRHAHLITKYLHFQVSRKAILGGKVKTVKIPHQHYRVKSNSQCLVAVNDLLALNVTTVDIRDCKEAWKKYKRKHHTTSTKHHVCWRINRTEECARYETYRRDWGKLSLGALSYTWRNAAQVFLQVSAQRSFNFPILHRVV